MGLMINDVDLKTTYKFVTTDVNGRGAPPVERSTLEDLSFDGAIELGTKLGKRDISITGYVYGTSPSNARTNKDNLISFISQGYTDELKITFPDTSRSIYAKLAGTPIVWQAQGPTLNAVAYSVTLNFVALDPYFYGSDFSATGSNASGMIKLSTEAPLYLVDPRRTLYKREPKLKVYPVTVVNLLGKDGDFETDSNSDGLADKWIINNPPQVGTLATDRVTIGTKSQKLLSQVLDAGNSLISIRINSIFQTGNAYFTSVWTCSNKALFWSFSYNLYGSNFERFTFDGDKTPNRFNRHYITYTANYADFMIVYKADAAYEDFTVWLDGAMVVNLTRMGVLPPPLKEYFNNVPSTWADLATSSNITAVDGKVQSGNAWLNDLLPYVNGVGTLGYAWGA